MKTAKQTLEEKGIKDTLLINGEWVKGGLSDLMEKHIENNLQELYLTLDECVKAIVFTRDYVEPKVSLPPIEGWSWFDACKKVEKIIPNSTWVAEFNKRIPPVVAESIDEENNTANPK